MFMVPLLQYNNKKMRVYILLFFVAISYCNLINYCDSDYTMIGIDENGHEIDNCISQCFENNCTIVAHNEFKCQNTQWVKFKSNKKNCDLFMNRSHALEKYIVYALDYDNNIIPNTTLGIYYDILDAINYGCGLLILFSDAIYFGITLTPTCYASCLRGFCSIDCPVGQSAVCICENAEAPQCQCR